MSTQQIHSFGVNTASHLARTPECALQPLVHFIIFTTIIITLVFYLHKMKTKHIQQICNSTNKLLVIPAVFRFSASFTLNGMTSRTSSQSPKYDSKWRLAMFNFGLLWRGISVGSDVSLERNFSGIRCTLEAKTTDSNST